MKPCNVTKANAACTMIFSKEVIHLAVKLNTAPVLPVKDTRTDTTHLHCTDLSATCRIRDQQFEECSTQQKA
jgi:hypothetical protein